MKIQQVKYVNQSVPRVAFKKAQSTAPQENPEKSEMRKKIRKYMPLIIGAAGALAIVAGILSKSTFKENIAKKGLEFRDNVLVNKETGEKFTGKIKSNVGAIGFNRRETRVFTNGIIDEVTYRSTLGRELEGTFYKDGKEFMSGHMCGSILPKHNRFGTYRYLENGEIFEHGDGYNLKESFFEYMRNCTKNASWLKRPS